ncbi:MAG: hypothetical protein ACK4OP_08090 [Gemmobacter sp.]
MPTPETLLAAMAEIGAMRNLLVQALALRLIEDPAPQQSVDFLGRMLTAMPTQPPAGQATGLDPAVSDYLAALTDERTAALVDDLRDRVRLLAG